MDEDVEAVFGRRLREVRESRGLTQAKLAELSGVSLKLVGAVERGEQNPSLRVLTRLAAGLRVATHELLRTEHQASAKLLRARIESRLRSASDDEIRQVYRLLDAILPPFDTST